MHRRLLSVLCPRVSSLELDEKKPDVKPGKIIMDVISPKAIVISQSSLLFAKNRKAAHSLTSQLPNILV